MTHVFHILFALYRLLTHILEALPLAITCIIYSILSATRVPSYIVQNNILGYFLRPQAKHSAEREAIPIKATAYFDKNNFVNLPQRVARQKL